jgi:hypothetical protein
MNGLALAAALALAQTPAAGDAPAPEPGAAPAEPAPAPAPAPSPTRRARPTAAPGVEASGATTTAAPRLRANVNPSTRIATPPGPLPAGEKGKGEGVAEEAQRAARDFLAALARGDADALAQAAADRFSFDGDVQAGREAIRRTWRNLLAARAPSPAPRVGDVEILPVEIAIARHGAPPPRLAALARAGVLVAIADLGGRTVVLFLARENGRVAVLGMQG